MSVEMVDLEDLSWTTGVDTPGGDACAVRVMDGRAFVMHQCGADVEDLGSPRW